MHFAMTAMMPMIPDTSFLPTLDELKEAQEHPHLIKNCP